MTFNCSFTGCTAFGAPDQMWNLERRQTEGKLVVLCTRHSHDARRAGFKAFRLSATFQRDAERRARRGAANQFFAAFKKAEKKAEPPSPSSPTKGNASCLPTKVFKKLKILAGKVLTQNNTSEHTRKE